MVFQVAIDGPSASGKSSIARDVAKYFNFVHINTGLMYRAIALKALQNKINLENENKLSEMVAKTSLELTPNQDVFLDGVEVSHLLKDLSLAASAVSAHPRVRELLVKKQQEMAQSTNCVMDGRDIGSVVLPNASIKIFITAEVEDRAMRRYNELKNEGYTVDYKDILHDMIKRDKQDVSRPVGPLRQAADAVKIDTTGNTFQESLELIINEIKKVYTKEEVL